MKDTSLMFQKAGMLSPDGRCKTLDASADGYVRGEFCGSLCLQACDPNAPSENQSPVSILGTAVNQDGRSSALTAPNGPAQQSVIRAALASTAGVEAGDVSMLQMHGTGTPLGDPIEVGALHATLMQSRYGPRTRPILMRSAGSSYDHGCVGAFVHSHRRSNTQALAAEKTAPTFDQQ